MANGDPIQGLRVAFKFADSQDTKEILRNLELNIEDLNRIRRIASDGGVQKTDIRTLSGLSIDLEKEALAVYNETQSYQNVLTNLNDGNRNIAGNININSSLISPSFKFKTINYGSPSGTAIETVDFSTSRASAWSSFGSSEASIFYGGDVTITGATSEIELSSLQFMETPKAKRFESEVATHKIRVSIDNEPYDLYAMKAIPIQFKAFFRSATNMRIDFNILNNLRPSWIIKNPPINGVQPEFVFQNRTTTTGIERTSQISFFDSRSTERTIEFYYPTDRILRIFLNATRLLQIPYAVLPKLIYFSATDNDLTEMPDVATLYPSIIDLDLSRNDLTRSNTPQLKTFSPQVIQRLKNPNNTLKTLVLDNAYANQSTIAVTSAVSDNQAQAVITVTTASEHGLLVGTNINISFSAGAASATGGIFTVASVPSTTTFTYVSRSVPTGSTPGSVVTLYAIPDLGQLVNLTKFQAVSGTNARRMTGTSPAIGASILEYNIQANLFNTLHPSVLQSTSLQVLNIRSNGISTALDTSGTNLQAIRSFTSGGNSHPIVNLSAKPDLRTYISDNQNFTVNAVGTTVFQDCPLLSRIDVYSSNITGRLPNFSTNTALSIFYSWGSQWQDASVDYCIESNTFGPTSGGCRPTLTNFQLQSSNLRGPIHPDAFRNMPLLNTIVVRSNKSGITGVYPPSIDQCFNLRALYLDNNFLGGDVPNFGGNSRINTIVLSQNSFTGKVPLINLPQLSTFIINNNSLTGFLGLTCPNLTQLNASFNLLTQIPRLLNIPRLQILLLNSNPNMTYVPGELSLVTGIRRIEMANCGFSRGTVDQILVDLNENYNLNPRRGIFVNLVGNSSPSAITEITTIINRLRREGWTLGLQA